MKWEYKLSLAIIFIVLIILGGIFGGIIGGVISLFFGYGETLIGIGFGIGCLLGVGCFLVILDIFDVINLNRWIYGPPPYSKDPFWSQGELEEESNRKFGRVEKVEERDDYKDLDWLRHQYIELGKNIQEIANEQGTSMITIRRWIDKLKLRYPRLWNAPPKPKDNFRKQGRCEGEIKRKFEKVERVAGKDTYKDLNWLRYQYIELGKNIQEIANEQGVSMIKVRKWLDKFELI